MEKKEAVVASRAFSDHSGIRYEVRIHFPVMTQSEDWSSLVLFIKLDDSAIVKSGSIIGIDGIQALQLAIQFIETYVSFLCRT